MAGITDPLVLLQLWIGRRECRVRPIIEALPSSQTGSPNRFLLVNVEERKETSHRINVSFIGKGRNENDILNLDKQSSSIECSLL